VEKFIFTATTEAKEGGVGVDVIIQKKLSTLAEMVNGYDFAQVIEAYWSAHQSSDEKRKIDAVRWLRGEFSTKTDARNALGVRTIIDDATVYDQLKLMSVFVRLCGFSGLLVCLDEMVNLYKLANSQARSSNYEQILRILNDVLQGTVTGFGVVLGGTPEFLMDTRRGLYSYAALQSRLAENSFAKNGLVDYQHPVVRLSSLSQEDFLVLLHKIQHVFAFGDEARYILPEEALTAFMAHCHVRGCGIFDLHAFDQFPQSIECRNLIPEEMSGLRHNRAGDDKRSSTPQHFCRRPKMVGIQAIDGGGKRSRIKYYDRRECGRG
jgi:hypothetical protein